MAMRNNKITHVFSVSFDDPLMMRMLRAVTDRDCTKTQFVREAVAEKLSRDEQAKATAQTPAAAPIKKRKIRRRR